MPQTTLILKNACIYTMDGRVEEAVAISGDKIAKVGSNQEMEHGRESIPRLSIWGDAPSFQALTTPIPIWWAMAIP